MAPSVANSSGGGAFGSGQPWMVINQGEQQTLSIEQIADLYGQGQLSDMTYVWREGMAEWLPIANVPELKAAMPEPIEPEPDAGPVMMDDSLPTAMFRASVQPPAPPAGVVGPGRSGMGVPLPEPSISGMTAARRPGAIRPDLFQAASAADPTLASAPARPQPAPRPMIQNIGGQIVIPGQKESSLLNMPTAFFMAQLSQPKRKRRVFVAAGVGAVLLIGGAIVGAKLLDTKEVEASTASFDKLNTCLLGSPLAANETVASRVRNIQLTVVGLPIERRAKPGEQGWPARCAIDAHDLATHGKAAGGAYEVLGASSEVLAKALQDDPAATVGFKEPLEKYWADAEKAGIKFTKAAEGVVPAPTPAAPLNDKDFRALPKLLGGSFTPAAVRPEPFPQETLHFVVDQQDMPDGPQICAISPTEDRIRCSKIPAAAAKFSPGLRLWGTSEAQAKPYYFAGDKGALGIFRPEGGEQVAAAVSTGAVSRKDGSFFALTRAGSNLQLVSVSEKGSAVTRPFISGTEVSSPQLTSGIFWDHIAYKTGPRSSTPSHLVFRKLPDAAGEPGAPIDAGPIDEPTPGEGEPERKGGLPRKDVETDEDRQMAGCRTAEATVVRLRGVQNDFLSFFQAGRWSPPVKSPSKGGALTCRKTEATTVKATTVMEQEKNWASISHVKCNIAGCTPTTVSMKDLIPGLVEIAPTDARSIGAVDVDGKLLVLWNAGYTGGLRMRLSAPSTIKDAEDVVLVDDRDEGSAMKLVTVTDIKLVSAGSYAVAFLTTPAGVKTLRIDSAGKVTPLASQ